MSSPYVERKKQVRKIHYIPTLMGSGSDFIQQKLFRLPVFPSKFL